MTQSKIGLKLDYERKWLEVMRSSMIQWFRVHSRPGYDSFKRLWHGIRSVFVMCLMSIHDCDFEVTTRRLRFTYTCCMGAVRLLVILSFIIRWIEHFMRVWCAIIYLNFRGGTFTSSERHFVSVIQVLSYSDFQEPRNLFKMANYPSGLLSYRLNRVDSRHVQTSTSIRLSLRNLIWIDESTDLTLVLISSDRSLKWKWKWLKLKESEVCCSEQRIKIYASIY